MLGSPRIPERALHGSLRVPFVVERYLGRLKLSEASISFNCPWPWANTLLGDPETCMSYFSRQRKGLTPQPRTTIYNYVQQLKSANTVKRVRALGCRTGAQGRHAATPRCLGIGAMGMATDNAVLNARHAAPLQPGSLRRGCESKHLETLVVRSLPRSDPRGTIVLDIARVSDSTRLGIALLLSLSDACPDRVTIDALTAATGGTYAAVARILRRLAQARLVRSTRGPGGGWRLSVPPGCIALRQVIGALRTAAPSPNGSTARERSTHRGSALLDSVIRRSQASLVRTLASVSLADMLDMERQAGER